MASEAKPTGEPFIVASKVSWSARRLAKASSSSAAEAHASGADALDQRALGRELDLEPAGEHFRLRLGIEADVGGDDFRHRGFGALPRPG